MSTQGWIGLRLDPLDVLFFRDGRPFGAANRVEGGLPNPQTLAGAVRTAMLGHYGMRGADFKDFHSRMQKGATAVEALAEIRPEAAWVGSTRFRGPWIGLKVGKDRVEPLLPQPMTTVKPKDETGKVFLRSKPLDEGVLPGWDGPLLPLWKKGRPDGKATRGLLTLTALRSFLQGDDVSLEQLYKPDELFGHDNRVGIAVNKDTLTSEEGQIYGIRMLALKPAAGLKDETRAEAPVCLYAEMQPGAGAPAELPGLGLLPLGGEGRYVGVKSVKAQAWPTAGAVQGRSLLYLATPAVFPGGGTLPSVNGLTVKAAASSAPSAVSGWDVAANGPRPTRFAIPAGAVYFVEAAGPDFDSLCSDAALAQEGWGFALQGKW